MIRLGGRTLAQINDQARAGGDRSRLREKLPVPERLALLPSPGSFVEDGGPGYEPGLVAVRLADAVDWERRPAGLHHGSLPV